MSLGLVQRMQVEVVVNQLLKYPKEDRAEMFKKIEERFCLECGQERNENNTACLCNEWEGE